MGGEGGRGGGRWNEEVGNEGAGAGEEEGEKDKGGGRGERGGSAQNTSRTNAVQTNHGPEKN